MPPKLSPELVKTASGFVASFITSQREKYLLTATPLAATHQQSLASFFSSELLSSTRVLVLKNARIENPPFYPIIKMMGFRNLPDQSNMAAITFNDVVVSHEPFSNGLLFHELVHVEQYRQLGVERFSELYVSGFLKGGSYEAIPMEVIAYSLEVRYRTAPRQPFSVADEVRQWIREERF